MPRPTRATTANAPIDFPVSGMTPGAGAAGWRTMGTDGQSITGNRAFRVGTPTGGGER